MEKNRRNIISFFVSVLILGVLVFLKICGLFPFAWIVIFIPSLLAVSLMFICIIIVAYYTPDTESEVYLLGQAKLTAFGKKTGMLDGALSYFSILWLILLVLRMIGTILWPWYIIYIPIIAPTIFSFLYVFNMCRKASPRERLKDLIKKNQDMFK